jgi:dienelactone hydrolase
VLDMSPTGRHPAVITRALVACVLVAAACSSGGGADERVSGGEQTARRSTPPSAPFAVGRRSTTLVDPSRPTPAVPGKGLAEHPERTIELEVVYPADGEAGPPPTGEPVAARVSVVDAPPAEGSFPLLVFAHGWNGLGGDLVGLAEPWAREGYVVALPTFPLSRKDIAWSDDLVNQPGDVSFVIDELTGLDRDDPLAGHIDGEHVAVGGHSLGAATVFGVGYNSCCIDDRIDATIPVSGGSLPYEGGTYESLPATPMLLVHGVKDQIVSIAVGDAMFDQALAPVWYLRATEADHITVFVGAPGALLNDVIVAFLDAELKGDTAALDTAGEAVRASGIAEWRVKS